MPIDLDAVKAKIMQGAYVSLVVDEQLRVLAALATVQVPARREGLGVVLRVVILLGLLPAASLPTLLLLAGSVPLVPPLSTLGECRVLCRGEARLHRPIPLAPPQKGAPPTPEPPKPHAPPGN